MRFDYECPECGEKTTVQCTAGTPAQTYGDPSLCYPSEPAEIDPSECAHCDFKFDMAEVFKAAPESDFDSEERDS